MVIMTISRLQELRQMMFGRLLRRNKKLFFRQYNNSQVKNQKEMKARKRKGE